MRLIKLVSLALPLALVPACADESAIKTIAQAVCPPPDLFQHAVCVCEDLAHVGALTVKPGPAGVGSVGVNGKTSLVAFAEISGAWHAWGGFAAVGASIGDTLITPGDVRLTGDVTIAGDAIIGGDLTCTGRLAIDGALALGGDAHVVGSSAIPDRTAYVAPAGPPCDCDPSTFFDVAAAVAAAKQATGGQSSFDHIGKAEIHLTGGNYYVTSADVIGHTEIFVDGPASVFVDGALRSVGATQWKLADGATLDLFVSGDVASVGLLSAGKPSDPTAFRLYVGGAGTTAVGAVGFSEFYGSLYAPRAAISYVGDAKVVGSIFARTILGVGSLAIEYGDAVQQPTSCEPPADPVAPTDPDAPPAPPTGDGPIFL